MGGRKKGVQFTEAVAPDTRRGEARFALVGNGTRPGRGTPCPYDLPAPRFTVHRLTVWEPGGAGVGASALTAPALP